MNTRNVSWILEFACVTAIGIIPSAGLSLWWVGVPALLIVLLKFLEARSLDRERHLHIRQQLELLMSVLPTDGAHVRCTYHVPFKTMLRRQPMLRQAFDYVGDQGGGGRSFPVGKGIIGVAYSAKGTRVENFSDDGEYRQRMVNEYKYSQGEVGQRRADRRSYLCDPILDESHNVLGLLYFDADRYGFFTSNDGNPRWRMITSAANVIRGPLLG